jgi:multidrug efflux pump subunit AcrA (membrane-fusion protein)
MSERTADDRPNLVDGRSLLQDEGGLHAPPHLSTLGKVWWWFHFAILVKLARLRFIAILVAIGLVIAKWDTLSAWYEKWTRPLFGPEAAVSADTEYWCPMHPTIVRDHPDKCPICAMPLSKRKKGEKPEEEALPPGVVSRVQLTPYKVAVAGIETAPIAYRSLTKEITAAGFVEFDERRLARITTRPTGKSRIDELHVNVTGQKVEKGQPLAELYSPELMVTAKNLVDARHDGNRDLEEMSRDRLRLWGIDRDQIDQILKAGKPVTHLTIRSPISGYVIKKYQIEGEYVEEGMPLYDVADLSTVWVEAQVYEADLPFLKEGQEVILTTTAYPTRTFPCGKLAFIQPHLDASTRTIKVRFDIHNPGHELRPGMHATVHLQVPTTDLDLLPSDAGEKQTQQYKEGLVLAVPEQSVIDTGSRKFVYREVEPDVYEGVEVQLGPRGSGFYPVLRGLHEGDQVATVGSFLIDAETRLTGAASAMYFGSSSGPAGDHRSATTAARPSMMRDEDAKVQATLAKLDAEGRRLAEEQGYCPVLNTRLGTMGVPVAVTLPGGKVFVCCKGCVKPARSDEKVTLAKVAELKARMKAGATQPAPTASKPPVAPGSRRADVRANLAKLNAEDQRLAEAQRFCAVQTARLLGAMGVPVKVMIRGRPVFLCCPGCEDDALEKPDETLAEVEKLKAKAASQK